MKITQAGEYALLALIFLAKQPEGKLIMIDEISRTEKIPKGFLAKILQTLAKTGVIRSRQGARGGFSLAKRPEQVTVLEVIEAIEGKIALQRCLEEEGCEKMEACTLCAVFSEAQNRVVEVFAQMTLHDLMLPKDAVMEKVRQRRGGGVKSPSATVNGTQDHFGQI